MRFLTKIPWRALLVFAIGMVIAFPLGAKYGHRITWLTTEKTLEKTGVSEKVNKPTNEITNQIEVPKIKKSEPVQIIMSPDNQQMIVVDTCIGIDTSKLTSGQKKRLERWLGRSL